MLAIAGGKGGCGKTTTAVGLALALARRGQAPLLVDADCDMPDVHHVVGIEHVAECPETSVRETTGVDALANGATLRAAVTTVETAGGVAVLTGGHRENLNGALQRARQWAGPVFVDCPAGVTPVATRPLRHADHTLLVTTDRPECVEDGRATLVTARELHAQPVGTIVRETDDGTVDSRLLAERVLTTLPTVTGDPLDHRSVRGRLQEVARTLPANTSDKNN